jgi:hypothetical protein
LELIGLEANGLQQLSGHVRPTIAPLCFGEEAEVGIRLSLQLVLPIGQTEEDGPSETVCVTRIHNGAPGLALTKTGSLGPSLRQRVRTCPIWLICQHTIPCPLPSPLADQAPTRPTL